MKPTRILALVVLVAGAVFLAGCTGKRETPPADTTPPPVAEVTPPKKVKAKDTFVPPPVNQAEVKPVETTVSTSTTGTPGEATVEVMASAQGFLPSTLTVRRDTVVKLTLFAVDASYRLNLPAYRIDQRANAGEKASIEFKADKTGEFVYSDPDKPTIKGTLLVVE